MLGCVSITHILSIPCVTRAVLIVEEDEDSCFLGSIRSHAIL